MLTLLLACKEKDVAVPDFAERPEHVVWVVIDGIRDADSLIETSSPSFKTPTNKILPELWSQLVPIGSRFATVWNSGDTRTGPAHAALIAGRHVPIGQFSVRTGAGSYVSDWPGIVDNFQEEAGASPEETIALSNGVLPVIVSRTTWPGPGQDATWIQVDDVLDDDSVYTEGIAQLNNHPRLLFINAHHADTKGHAGEEDAYLQNIAYSDTGIVSLWNAIQADDFYKNKTLLVVTSDHGRHSLGDLGGWKNHEGDDCNGDRGIPLLMVGPGVPVGKMLNGRFDANDILPTIQELMGFSSDYSQGQPLPIQDWPTQEGTLFVEGDRAEVVLTGEREARTKVVIDGETVSTAGVYEARGLTMKEGEGGWLACWRELNIESGNTVLPYRPRCLLNGQDIGFPADRVYPHWRPAIMADGSDFLVAWVDNPDGATDELETIGTRVSRLHSGVWSEEGSLQVSVYPHAVEIGRGVDGVVRLWWSESQDQLLGRYTRRIRMMRWSGSAWEEEFVVLPDREERLERSALSEDGSILAVLVGKQEGAGLALIQMDSGRREDLTVGAVLPGVAPWWEEGVLWWVEYGSKLCTLTECVEVEGEIQDAGPGWGVAATEGGLGRFR